MPRRSEPSFEKCGVKIYLCKFTSKDSVFWWFMFEDQDKCAKGAVRDKHKANGGLWKEYGTKKDLGGTW